MCMFLRFSRRRAGRLGKGGARSASDLCPQRRPERPRRFPHPELSRGANPRAGCERLRDESTSEGDAAMHGTLVRYRAKPERAEENQQLIENVFAELHAKSPEGIRYLALRLGDGTFVHFSVQEGQ